MSVPGEETEPLMTPLDAVATPVGEPTAELAPDPMADPDAAEALALFHWLGEHAMGKPSTPLPPINPDEDGLMGAF